MSLFDIFKITKFKDKILTLQNENAELKSLLQPEHYELLDLKKEIASSISEKEKIEYDTQTANSILLTLTTQYEAQKQKLLVIDEQLLLESFAHYEPKYELQNSSDYNIKLDSIRVQQKNMIKAGTACTGNMGWTVNNKASEGKKMVNDMIKLVLRSFNNECDVCVSNVKFNNIETHEKRINSSYDALEKLGKIMQVSISFEYKKLKFEELYLAHEFQLKKQEEKEEQKQIRDQIREEAKLQKEIEETRKTVDKEKKHHSNALDKAKKQLEACDSIEERTSIQEKIDELNLNLIEIDRQLKDIDYREANQRAGYVYVISNIGAFGENIFKIGMTRRLDPYDRVYELSDASVPFNFDVHAMIFSDDAPKLENALHNMFEDRKVNAINYRREFFRVTLDEIEDVIKKNHDKTVEFIKTAEAEQYRESLLIRQRKSAATFEIEQAYKEAAVTVENY
ncbi:DUF4041 domain-containing protein [Paenibacillus sp. FA6]|uniref:DUF4041 domain-containing protein n=1 Tax=Paenibacillus sp. FA6 TaxID=3413029 RepID=UPI003F660412